ncbi:MAG: hypothetical protein ACJAS1_002621 [Oleiphilaceae bacterium]|jgi:hypothetical protein
MNSCRLKQYFDTDNLQMRISWLREYGHESSVWVENKSSEMEHVVEIVDPCYVSKPCWKEIYEKADRIERITLDLNIFYEWENEADIVDVYQFFFSNIDAAKIMALRVQSSARNIRKDDFRRIRLDQAGGFHDKSVLEKLYEIQRGRCYYSGAPLVKQPKNFVVDHILSIYKGGSGWPKNIALVIKEINTLKGGHASRTETLNWLAKELGQSWLRDQKAYCREVDQRREELDREFRRVHESNS